MGTRALAEWASLLGMKVAARAPPRDESGWTALLGPDREVLLKRSIRLASIFSNP